MLLTQDEQDEIVAEGFKNFHRLKRATEENALLVQQLDDMRTVQRSLIAGSNKLQAEVERLAVENSELRRDNKDWMNRYLTGVLDDTKARNG